MTRLGKTAVSPVSPLATLFKILLMLFHKGEAKSLYRNCAGRHFYETENEIWAGFGPVGNTEKKLGPTMSNF